ncbi:MAG: ATP-dependent DNA helicase, partial [Chitinophagaceae bacterium]|nr:ATP-dependent DNA helicase [Chitinophagaceae bacterium]
ITRAKQKLWLSYANTRYRYGQLVQNDPSRFLEEIPGKYLDKSYSGANSRAMGGWNSGRPAFNRNGGWGDYNDLPMSQGGAARKKPATPASPSYVTPTAPKVVEHQPSANFTPSDTSRLEAGQEVEHQKFGFGKVTRIEGSAHNPVATIVFVNNGEKKIMLNYAKLRIVNDQS